LIYYYKKKTSKNDNNNNDIDIEQPIGYNNNNNVHDEKYNFDVIENLEKYLNTIQQIKESDIFMEKNAFWRGFQTYEQFVHQVHTKEDNNKYKNDDILEEENLYEKKEYVLFQKYRADQYHHEENRRLNHQILSFLEQERDRIDEVINFYKKEEEIEIKEINIKNIIKRYQKYQPFLERVYKKSRHIAYQKALQNMLIIYTIFHKKKDIIENLKNNDNNNKDIDLNQNSEKIFIEFYDDYMNNLIKFPSKLDENNDIKFNYAFFFYIMMFFIFLYILYLFSNIRN